MQIQWYPGHMTKAKRAMQEDMKLIDLVIELTDARIVQSGRNPDIGKLAGNKARLMLLNKADLADARATAEWINYWREQGVKAIALDARQSNLRKTITAAAMEACKELIERNRRRGIKNQTVQAMVCGIPNVGKSTLINSLAGKAAARTGNKPGVTKGNQWIRVDQSLQLLDTPGLLWPKFEDPTVGLHLAITGSISDDVLNLREVALELVRILAASYPGAIPERYGSSEYDSPEEGLMMIGARRGCLQKGGEIDLDKAARVLLDDFRGGRLGRISLEYPVRR